MCGDHHIKNTCITLVTGRIRILKVHAINGVVVSKTLRKKVNFAILCEEVCGLSVTRLQRRTNCQYRWMEFGNRKPKWIPKYPIEFLPIKDGWNKNNKDGSKHQGFLCDLNKSVHINLEFCFISGTRYDLVHDLLVTERLYCKQLGSVLDIYAEPLRLVRLRYTCMKLSFPSIVRVISLYMWIDLKF